MITLNFEPNLEHQTHAINAVVDLFNGQPTQANGLNDSFNLIQPLDTIDNNTGSDSSQASQTSTRQAINSQTIANQRTISDEQLLDNIQSIQKANGIEPSTALFDDNDNDGKQPIQYGLPKYGINASIEMETGTGKTYVYLRSILELYQKYGMRKFVIVVPSVAIREGVLKSIEMTKSHFANLYDNTPVNARVYDSKKLSLLRDFATSNVLQILVINIDAFAKDENIINQVRERGIAPIEYIQATHPIVIVDEPQNMETQKRLDAIASLNPLITLRYSATHKFSRHLLYSLNPVKAYDAGLVKQIEVDSVMADDKFNDAYIELLDITPKKTKITAKVSVYANVKGVVKKKTISVSDNDDLYKKTGREIYANGYVVTGINAVDGYIEFSNGTIVKLGQQLGGMTDSVMRYQIERTIEAHLDKQRKLMPMGIKVLSLLFIDRVDNYLVNTDTSYARSGKFAKWFESLYQSILDKPKYNDLKQQLATYYQTDASGIHNGYFSVDNKGRAKDTSGSTKADDDTYGLIMKDKEKLLDLSNPLQFIFSHSALREGWDNPNVFQICTLNETKSSMKKRQEIGRGLRLCVGADGNRIYDKQVNILTVIANESYDDFAKSLQSEIADDYGIEFNGVKNIRDKREVMYRKGFMLDDNFKAIWDKIKQKTQYQVRFDSNELINVVAHDLKNMQAVEAPHLSAIKKRLIISDEGVDGRLVAVNSQVATYQLDSQSDKQSESQSSHKLDSENEKTKTQNDNQSRQSIWQLPDVLTYLTRHTKLTRQTLVQILAKSERIDDLFVNPKLFLDRAVSIIKEQQANLMVAGVAYHKNGQSYSQTLLEALEQKTTSVYVSDYHFEVDNPNKTIVENLIPLDSNTEHQFAKDCESMPTVRFYFKLPNWFKIDTPVGTYNPDWAVVKEDENEVNQLYFIAETKNTGRKSAGGHSVDIKKLGLEQQQKIHCGQAHFNTLDNEINYKVVEMVSQL